MGKVIHCDRRLYKWKKKVQFKADEVFWSVDCYLFPLRCFCFGFSFLWIMWKKEHKYAMVDLDCNWNNSKSCKYSSDFNWVLLKGNKNVLQVYIYECASLLLLELPKESSMFTRCSPGYWLIFGFGGMWVWIALSCCIGHFCCHVSSDEETQTTLPEKGHKRKQCCHYQQCLSSKQGYLLSRKNENVELHNNCISHWLLCRLYWRKCKAKYTDSGTQFLLNSNSMCMSLRSPICALPDSIYITLILNSDIRLLLVTNHWNTLVVVE